MEELVLRQVAAILELSGTEMIDPRRGFFELGLGSLGSIELAERLGRSLERPLPPTVANEQTLRQQAEAALVSNRAAITSAQSWLAANTGTLTTAQLSNVMRSVMQALVENHQQHNKLIRVLLGKFDGTD